MKKVRLAIIAAAMITSLLPLNSFAATTITASRDADHRGIAYDITSDDANAFLNGFNVSASKSDTVKFDNALGDWSGYTTFTGRIIIEKVLEANAANVDFKVEDTSYNLYENVGSTEDVKADDFAQEICKNVGVVVTGNTVDSSNPMYSVSLEDGVLTVKDVVNGETAKDVKITIDGKEVSAEGKVVTGDSVNVMFGNSSEDVLTTSKSRVWAAAEKMNAKLGNYTEQGVESIFMHNAGADAEVNGNTVEIDSKYGDFAVFTVKSDKAYEVRSFADTGIIELFQAMFGDVVRADITALAFDEDGTVTEGGSSTIDNMNAMTPDTLKGEIADKLIALLTEDPRKAKMNELLGKGATAKVTYSNNTVETYSVVFVPSSAMSYGETSANINE